MTLILAFNADFYTLVNRDRVEKIQLKYIMILQRYLRYRMIILIHTDYRQINLFIKLQVKTEY